MKNNRVANLWRSFKEKRRREVYPSGATLFHIRALLERKLVGNDLREAKVLMQKFGFSELFVAQGNAHLVNGKASIVVGPSGVGKSTVSKKLVRNRKARQIEEALVLFGKKGNQWFLVETGIKRIARKNERLKENLRKGIYFKRERYGNQNPIEPTILKVASKFQILFGKKNNAVVKSKIHEVKRLVFVKGNDSIRQSQSLIQHIDSSGKSSTIENIELVVPKSVKLKILSTYGKRGELKDNIEKAILGESV